MDIRKLSDKKLFLLDLDGTLYLDENLFDGVKDFLCYVKETGGRYLFLTNNSSKSVDAYVDKMKRLGILATGDDFITSADATVKYLLNKNYNKIYAFGTDSFKKQLSDARLPITDILTEGIDCLVCGYDTELTFKKIEDACIILSRPESIDFIATNPDWVCPTAYGYLPDCGSVCELLCRASGKKPHFIGKPMPDMIYLALEKTHFAKENTVLIGDRLYTDVASALAAGVDGYLVLSGETSIQSAYKDPVKPTRVFSSVREIYEMMKVNRQ